MKTIGEITKVGAGQSAPQDASAFSNDGIPFVRAGSLEFLCKGASLDKLERINERQAKIHKLKLYPSGTILFAKSGMSAVQNRVFVLPKSCYVVSHLATVEVKNGVDSKFLSYFWQNFKTSNLIQDPAYPSVSLEAVKEVEIELPNLDEQKRIAAILDKADRLRRGRRFAQTLADSFLQSVFIKMFGDPVSNSMNWEKVKLNSLGDLDRGHSKHRPRNAPHLYGGIYPFVQTGDIANSSGYIKTFRQTYSEEGLKQSKLWKSGTLCITIAANIAKTSILTFDACFPDSVVGFTPNQKTNVNYIQQWFSFVQRNLEETAPESAQKNINLEILRGLEIISPPLPLQEKFAEIVQKFERVRRQQREATRHATHLFQTLLHRAFRGEL